MTQLAIISQFDNINMLTDYGFFSIYTAIYYGIKQIRTSQWGGGVKDYC